LGGITGVVRYGLVVSAVVVTVCTVVLGPDVTCVSLFLTPNTIPKLMPTIINIVPSTNEIVISLFFSCIRLLFFA